MRRISCIAQKSLLFSAMFLGMVIQASAQRATLSDGRGKLPVVAAETISPDRLVVVYRGGVLPLDASALLQAEGVHVISHLPLLGLSTVRATGDVSRTMTALLQHREVVAVLHDRVMKAHAMQVVPVQVQMPRVPTQDLIGVAAQDAPFHIVMKAPIAYPVQRTEGPPAQVETYYNSPQGWATRLSGGYGNAVPGGLTVGPWNTTQGEGVRIAVLDSGVDKNHPSVSPNLLLNLSEVDQSAMPSACDDGSPQDQAGHGTFAASLAAAAAEAGGDMVIGVAPQANILNIKVLQRMPAATGATTLAQCEAGTAGGLLSWVLQGIEDAVANHANVISLSLGTLVDVSTGDGAGWVTQMDSVVYVAEQAGSVVVAAVGNDGLDLSRGTLVELPAQARGVLPVVAATNPACAENLAANAVCVAGPVTRAYYSNFGTNLNAIAAPGGSLPEGGDLAVSGFVRGACSEGVLNTVDGLPADGQSLGCFGLGHTPYVQATGTSAAAPLVAGAAALLRAAHPDWTPSQVVAALRSTAVADGSMTEPSLNLPAALVLQ